MNIIIVDDDNSSAFLSKAAIMEKDKDCVIIIMKEGIELFNHLEASAGPAFLPDLILLDINLPKLSGKEVLKAIKTNDNYKRIPVVILSATQNNQDVIDCLDLHANCFVAKAFDYQVFSEKIASLIHYWRNVATFPAKERFTVTPPGSIRKSTDDASSVA